MSSSTHSLAGAAGYPDVKRLPYAKAAVFAGTSRYVDLTRDIVTPGLGKVAIVTHIVVPGLTHLATATSPGVTNRTAVFTLSDATGQARYLLPIFLFDRDVATIVGTPSGELSPVELAAQPDRSLVWRPRMPLVVPTGWKLGFSSASALGTGGSHFGAACYGYVLEQYEAKMLGFDVTSVTPSPSGGIPQIQWIQNGLAATNGTQTLALARTGYTIQILEILARLQPDASGGAALILKDTDGNTIFNLKSDNRANQAEWQISPGLFLRPSQGLTLTGDAQSNGRGTVIVLARYVRNDEVPGDSWYAYFTPSFPSPAVGGGIGAINQAKSITTVVTKTYPRTDTTRTIPGQGLRDHLEGYVFSGSKDATVTTDQVIFGLTTSTQISPYTNLPGFSASGLNTNISPGVIENFVAPIMSLTQQNQDLNLTVSGLNVPCVPHTGKFVFTALATAAGFAATPTGTTNMIDGWSMTLWGRTIPTERAVTDNPQLMGDETFS